MNRNYLVRPRPDGRCVSALPAALLADLLADGDFKVFDAALAADRPVTADDLV
jgi:hypothetical protein